MTPEQLAAWEDKEYGSIRAIEPSLWDRSWLKPSTQMTMSTLPFGNLGNALVHTVGSTVAGVLDPMVTTSLQDSISIRFSGAMSASTRSSTGYVFIGGACRRGWSRGSFRRQLPQQQRGGGF
jgi:hypothetical protein